MGAEVLRCAATGNWTRHPPVCAGTVGTPHPSSTGGGGVQHPAAPLECGGGHPSSLGAVMSFCQLSNLWVCGSFSEDGAPFFKQVLAYSSGAALAVAGIVLSGTLIALLAKRLSDRGTEMPPAASCHFGQGLSDQGVTESQERVG